MKELMISNLIYNTDYEQYEQAGSVQVFGLVLYLLESSYDLHPCHRIHYRYQEYDDDGNNRLI